MDKRPTLADIAREADLSLSTVDRVINARAPVREQTARRVREAATSVGYDLPAPAVETDAGAGCRLGILLLNREQPFYADLNDAIEIAAKECQTSGVRCRIDDVKDLSPQSVARQITSLAGQCDVLAVAAFEHPTILQALDQVTRRGVRTYALLSPVGPPHAYPYIGLDNRQVGRTAAWSMARLSRGSGKVGIFIGSHRFVGHELREMGFRSYCREQAPEIEVLEPRVTEDDATIAYNETLDLLDRCQDLCGLYVAGGGMEGVIRALYERRQTTNDLCVITQELTPASRQALIDQVVTLVIATPTRQLAADLIHRVSTEYLKDSQGHVPYPGLPLILYTSENC